jgi:hypothetical protein
MGRICIYRRGTAWRYTVFLEDRCIRHGSLDIPDSAGQEEAIEAARGKYSGDASIIRIGDVRSFSAAPEQAKRNGRRTGPDGVRS